MDSGQNPTSPMPGNGLNSAPQSTPTVPPVAPGAATSASGPAPAANPATPPTAPTFTGTPAGPAPVFSAPQPAATASPLGGLRSRRNRSSRPNSSNSMIAPAQPMTPTGDVIMDMPATKRKSPINKGVIIGIIVAAVAVVGGVVALIMLPRIGRNNLSQARESFNKYIGYITIGDDGQESVDIPPDYNEWTIANISLEQPDAQKDYVNKLEELSTEFVNILESTNLDKKSDILESANNIHDLASSYIMYATLDQTIESIIGTYSANGRESAVQQISALGQNFNNESAKYMSEQISSYSNDAIGLLDIAARQGCISGSNLDQTKPSCANNNNFARIYNNLDRQNNKIIGFSNTVLNALKAEIFNMMVWLQYED